MTPFSDTGTVQLNNTHHNATIQRTNQPTDYLPNPMHLSPSRRATALAFAALVLLAVQPIVWGHLPWRGDGLLHLYRLAELARSVADGTLYPRWLPGLAYGYGFPLFNYYAPLSYYLLLPVTAVATPEIALRLGYAAAVVVTGAGVYAWARDVWGDGPTALTSAAAALFAPYVLTNALHRGALAEAWGLALLAITFWAVRRLLFRPNRATFSIALLSFAGLILSHNITALVGTALLLAYAGIAAWNSGQVRARLAPLALWLLLGLGLTAFFWLPALLEQDLVQIDQLVAPADFDFRNNFTTVAALLAPPRTADPALVNPPLPLSFGWPQVVLALLAWLPAALTPAERRLRAGLSLAVVLLAVMMLDVSAPLWEWVPLLDFVQFPWRLLGPASLLLALLAGLGARTLVALVIWGARRRIGRTGVALLWTAIAGTIGVVALPWLFPSTYRQSADLSPAGLIAFEQSSGALGTTSAADYLPRTVAQLPPPDSLLAQFEAAPSGVIARFDRTGLPSDVVVIDEQNRLLTDTVRYAADQPFVATFNRFAFPGWQIAVDGAPVTVTPTTPYGLLSAELPAGEHTVTLRFGGTPVRWTAAVLSLISLAISVVVVWRLPAASRQPPAPDADRRIALLIALLALTLFGLKTGVLDRVDSPLRRAGFDGEQVRDVATSTNQAFRFPSGVAPGGLVLLGYELPTSDPAADDAIDIELYWRALPGTITDLSASLHLVDASGRRFGQSDQYHIADFPVSRWQTGEYARDVHRIVPLPGTPPGAYTVQLFVTEQATGARLEALNENGLPVGTSVPLAQVTLGQPGRIVAEGAFSAENSASIPLTDALHLASYAAPATTVETGFALPLTLFWRATATPSTVYQAQLTVADAQERVVAAQQFAPGRADFPTTAWQPGQVVRDERTLVVPAVRADSADAVTPGVYTVHLRLLGPDGAPAGAPVLLQTVTVTTPTRAFDLPATATPLELSAGGPLRLAGATIDPDGDALTVTLYWQTDRPLSDGAHVFVHLLNEADEIVAQHDSAPANGARPMPGWLPGEVVADAHTVPRPAGGPYRLAVGVYDPVTGERWGDRLVLPLDVP